MKAGKRTRFIAGESFVRGFVATGLLVWLDGTAGGSSRSPRGSLRLALKGGFAIASGTVVAERLSRRDYTRSAAALAAGAACLVITDRYLSPSETDSEDRRDGEEEIQQVQG